MKKWNAWLSGLISATIQSQAKVSLSPNSNHEVKKFNSLSPPQIFKFNLKKWRIIRWNKKNLNCLGEQTVLVTSPHFRASHRNRTVKQTQSSPLIWRNDTDWWAYFYDYSTVAVCCTFPNFHQLLSCLSTPAGGCHFENKCCRSICRFMIRHNEIILIK